MNGIDYLVIVLYLAGILSLGYFLRDNKSDEDYFLGGKQMGWFPLALSTMATQLSAISFISAPAFVGLREGGGLMWLSYEFAVPIAMLLVLYLVMPSFYRFGVISIYDYLETRFDRSTRLLVSILFQIVRAFATGIMIYATAIILESVVGVPFFASVLIIGFITLIYSLQGGMKAVVYGDAIQMVLIVLGLILCGGFALVELGGFGSFLERLEPERLRAVNVSSMGFGGDEFGLLPMILGGLVLYVSYYGCDQTQAQRTLSARNYGDIRRLLIANGLLRFPITVLYCVVGLSIGVLAKSTPEFLEKIPADKPDYMMPLYILNYLPHGVIGLLLVALMAAAMSSLSSAVNSLAAVTVKDLDTLGVISKEKGGEMKWARIAAAFWGIVTLVLSAFAGGIAPTVIEAINKVGSALYGPVLGVFLIGFFLPRYRGGSAKFGMLLGLGVNLVLWKTAPHVFWMWWNAIGLAVTFLGAFIWSLLFSGEAKGASEMQRETPADLAAVLDKAAIGKYSVVLGAYFILIILISSVFALL